MAYFQEEGSNVTGKWLGVRRSRHFDAGGFYWKLLAFPGGNAGPKKCREETFLSVYLKAVKGPRPEILKVKPPSKDVRQFVMNADGDTHMVDDEAEGEGAHAEEEKDDDVPLPTFRKGLLSRFVRFRITAIFNPENEAAMKAAPSASQDSAGSSTDGASESESGSEARPKKRRRRRRGKKARKSQRVKRHSKETTKRYDARERDWGFKHYLTFDERLPFMIEKNSADLPDLACTKILLEEVVGEVGEKEKMIKVVFMTLELALHVRHEKHLVDPIQYDSKKETGFVGLRNQGCTCYLNSLLQTLFHLRLFRRLVYKIESEEPEDGAKPSIVLALQRLFYQMENKTKAVDTRELTKSFGWDSEESFRQHDVQELMNILFDRLEKKGPEITKLFAGVARAYTKCTEIDYQSHHDDTFSTICLSVQGCNSIADAFKKYCESELLSGENKYDTGNSDPATRYQPAERGMIFRELPPVLILLLKRFEFDPRTMRMFKVNDRFSFPANLDVSKYVAEECRRGLRPDADVEESHCEFDLFSVMVHRGDLTHGHYWAHVKADGLMWHRFDDEKVYEVTEDHAIKDNFGHRNRSQQKEADRAGSAHDEASSIEWASSRTSRMSNAYVLVYIKRSRLDQILLPASIEMTMPSHIPAHFAQLRKAKAKKEKDRREKHLYCVFSLYSRKQLLDHRTPNLRGPGDVFYVRILKKATIAEFKVAVEAELGIAPEAQFRFWNERRRKNKSRRPIKVLLDEALPPETRLDERIDFPKLKEGEITVFVEERPELSDASSNPHHTLVFFKFFDYKERTLTMLGYLRLDPAKTLNDHVELLHVMTKGKSRDGSLIWFEECTSARVDQIYPDQSLRRLEITDGDIVVFQKKPSRDEQKDKSLISDIPDFYRYLKHKRTVLFRKYPPALEEVLTGIDAAVPKAAAAAAAESEDTVDGTPDATAMDEDRKSQEGDFLIDTSTSEGYRGVAEKVVARLAKGGNPDFLRFWAYNHYAKTPVDRPMNEKKRFFSQLSKKGTVFQGKFYPVVYYEQLACPLQQLANQRDVTLCLYDPAGKCLKTKTFQLDKQMKIGPLIDEVEDDWEIPEGATRRCFVVGLSTLVAQVPDDRKVGDLEDNLKPGPVMLRLEIVPPDQIEAPKNELWQCVHLDNFSSSSVRLFGEPFYFRIRPEEKLSDLKPRLQAYLKIEDTEFKRYKFVPLVGMIKKTTILDTEVVAGRLASAQKAYQGHYQACLALMHRDADNKARELGVSIAEN